MWLWFMTWQKGLQQRRWWWLYVHSPTTRKSGCENQIWCSIKVWLVVVLMHLHLAFANHFFGHPVLTTPYTKWPQHLPGHWWTLRTCSLSGPGSWIEPSQAFTSLRLTEHASRQPYCTCTHTTFTLNDTPFFAIMQSPSSTPNKDFLFPRSTGRDWRRQLNWNQIQYQKKLPQLLLCDET